MMDYFVNTIREHALCDEHKDCRAAHDSFDDYFSEDETEAESDLEDLSADDDQLFCNCPNPPRNIIKQHYLHWFSIIRTWLSLENTKKINVTIFLKNSYLVSWLQ